MELYNYMEVHIGVIVWSHIQYRRYIYIMDWYLRYILTIEYKITYYNKDMDGRYII